MSHTQGKLIVRGGYSIYTEDGTIPIADACVTASKKTNDEANARRLVACWNACDILPTETLEIMGNLSDAIGSEFNKIKAERDSLRAVNAELLAFAHEWLERQGTDSNYMTEKARATIASARKQGEQG
jgi:hypothetical protein